MRRYTILTFLLCMLGVAVSSAQISSGKISSEHKISDGNSGFPATSLATSDLFGSSVTNLGDIDADPETVTALAVGAEGDEDEEERESARGAVWVLFLKADGTVKRQQKINARVGGFGGILNDDDFFGSSVANLGDIDADPETVTALAVGARGDSGRGAVWVLFLRADGTVKRQQKISALEGGFGGALSSGDFFGSSLASLDDLDGDGVPELAVGARGDDDGGLASGAVWVLFLNGNGTVKRQQKISALAGGFGGALSSGDLFGSSVADLGDIDADPETVTALAVGAERDGEPARGAVWVLFLKADGTVKRQQKINARVGGFGGILNDNDFFGSSVANLGGTDADPETVAALAVGAEGDDDGGPARGAVWVLFLKADGTVQRQQKISALAGGFGGGLDNSDLFGSSVAALGDLNGNGVPELAVGARGDDDGGASSGAVWVLFGNSRPKIDSPDPPTEQGIKISTCIRDDSGLDSTVINFRRAGDSIFLSAPMKVSSQSDECMRQEPWERLFDAKIELPEVFSDIRGVEYFITATDPSGDKTCLPQAARPCMASSSDILFIPVPGSITAPKPQPAGVLRFFSIPLKLDEKSQRPSDVLEDDLGDYDKTQWRFFDWNADTQAFDEFPDTSRMSPGRAFLLIVREEGETINTGIGEGVPTDTKFSIPLKQRWNIFGNPFNFVIPVCNIRLGSTGEPPVLRFYKGEGSDNRWNDTQADPVTRIVPFEGYAVFSADSDVLVIDPDLSPDEACPPDPVAPGARREEVAWSIRILARSQAARDVDTRAVVASGASEVWDRMDQPEPPGIGDYVSVYFIHPEWKRGGARYSIDARPEPLDGTVWPFEVITTVRDKVHLTFEGLAEVPPAYEVWLIDEALKMRQNLRETPHYTVAGSVTPRALKLLVGRRSFVEAEAGAEVPARFELSPNFPNPFNPTTTLRYGLPTAAEVSLIVYTVRGEKVATLEQGARKQAGYHAVIWDGRNDAGTAVASGVYFVRMRAGAFVQARKMVLIK